MDRLISIWSTRYLGIGHGWEFWDNGMGDGEYACFGRTGCQMAWIHLSKNPDDIAGAKDIAANYCRDNWSTCAKHESWEKVAGDFLAMAAGGVGAGSLLRREAAARIRAGCGPHSFVGDTPVLMADGTTKRIEELKIGDLVLATDPESGESGPREVVATIIGEGVKHLVEIEVDGSKVIATDSHPFWLRDQKRWVTAGELYVGSQLWASTGKPVRVAAIKKWIAIKRVRNLTVDDLHTYHVLVGDTPVLVHNCGVIPWSSGRIGSAAKALDDGATSVTLRSRSEVEELFLGKYQAAGYRNATGFDGKGTRQYFGEKRGTYHWDDLLDAEGRVAGHGANNRHGDLPHLQIHTFDGPVVRIFWDGR